MEEILNHIVGELTVATELHSRGDREKRNEAIVGLIKFIVEVEDDEIKTLVDRAFTEMEASLDMIVDNIDENGIGSIVAPAYEVKVEAGCDVCTCLDCDPSGERNRREFERSRAHSA